jgi:hypothetical protein
MKNLILTARRNLLTYYQRKNTTLNMMGIYDKKKGNKTKARIVDFLLHRKSSLFNEFDS